MRLFDVANLAAVRLNNAKALCANWLAPVRLANPLVLQRCMQLSLADVCGRYAGNVSQYSAERLVGRLLNLEQQDLLRLLVADKQAARQAWREERDMPGNKEALDEPSFKISIGDVAVLSEQHFCSLLERHLPNCAADFAASQAGLHDAPA